MNRLAPSHAAAPRAAGPAPYQGAGSYCYADSLVMALAGSRPDRPPPDVALVEVATTMPFGAALVEQPDGEPYMLVSPLDVPPEAGIDRALAHLGWDCDRQVVAGGEAVALAALVDAVAAGPVLAGPVDVGHLTYNPRHRALAGFDHFVVVLEVGDGVVRLHDPFGYPWASVPVERFLRGWAAVGGEPHRRSGGVVQRGEPFTLRSRFRPVTTEPAPAAVAAQVLPLVRDMLRSVESPEGGGVWRNAPALRRLAVIVEDRIPPGWAELAVVFTLPLGARRAADAAWVLGPVAPRGAAVLVRQARLFGEAHRAVTAFDRAGLGRSLRRIARCYEELGTVI